VTGDEFLNKLIESIEAGRSAALVTVVKATNEYAGALGKRALIWLDEPACGDLGLADLTAQALDDARQCLTNRQTQMLAYHQPAGQVELFVEVQQQPPTLLIVGAGHVALPLAQLGKMLEFRVIVLDDRPRFANKQRFPMADKVLAQPFRETLRNWPVDRDTYIVLVTRGHSHDVECLLEVINSPAHYIGMIGSKRRVKAVFELLEKGQEFDPARFDRVYAPIGLDIGAETPTEIALSIIAEIINIRRGGRASSLSDVLREDRRLPLHPARVETKKLGYKS
jgi:xanthine dehydrogenase accessory factor